jgi:hypothetical protein
MTMDCFGAPKDILVIQTSDQRSHFLADGWTASFGSRFPTSPFEKGMLVPLVPAHQRDEARFLDLTIHPHRPPFKGRHVVLVDVCNLPPPAMTLVIRDERASPEAIVFAVDPKRGGLRQSAIPGPIRNNVVLFRLHRFPGQM